MCPQTLCFVKSDETSKYEAICSTFTILLNMLVIYGESTVYKLAGTLSTDRRHALIERLNGQAWRTLMLSPSDSDLEVRKFVGV